MTEYQKAIKKRFVYKGMTKDESFQAVCVALSPTQRGMEAEMLEYLEQHPDASLQEVDDYWLSIAPSLEIWDDEEEEYAD